MTEGLPADGKEAAGTAASKSQADRAAGEAGEEGFLRVVCGDVNFGVHGRDFAVLFSRTEGGIVSLRRGGTEWITRPPVPVYWRATTDNDRGNHFSTGSHQWMGAGLFFEHGNQDVEIAIWESPVKHAFHIRFKSILRRTFPVLKIQLIFLHELFGIGQCCLFGASTLLYFRK